MKQEKILGIVRLVSEIIISCILLYMEVCVEIVFAQIVIHLLMDKLFIIHCDQTGHNMTKSIHFQHMYYREILYFLGV